jgi:hypothetical protein
MAPIIKKAEEKLKKAGHKVAEGTKEVAHGTAEVAKDVGHKGLEVGKEVAHGTAGVAKGVGHKTAHGMGRVAGKLDVTCDTCGKVMRPGGIYTRVIRGKEYQFCSVLCADNFKPVK